MEKVRKMHCIHSKNTGDVVLSAFGTYQLFCNSIFSLVVTALNAALKSRANQLCLA